jgi:hypothetical protein
MTIAQSPPASRAYGCGWVTNGCAVASCKRRSPCTGLFADDTWRDCCNGERAQKEDEAA